MIVISVNFLLHRGLCITLLCTTYDSHGEILVWSNCSVKTYNKYVVSNPDTTFRFVITLSYTEYTVLLHS